MGDRRTSRPDVGGEANFGLPAELIGHPARSAMLLALLDGRALPMTTLAGEAGIAASTASAHLGRLVEANLLSVVRQGRHRFYSLESAEVAEALEALARLTPSTPVTSMQADRRARRLRVARTCYDHVAGRLGIAVMQNLIERGALTGGDGLHHADRAEHDRLSAPGRDLDYALTDGGWALLDDLDVRLTPSRTRPLVRYCVDWTEQRHHVAGALGAALLGRFEADGWVERGDSSLRRALQITDRGVEGFRDVFEVDEDAYWSAAA